MTDNEIGKAMARLDGGKHPCVLGGTLYVGMKEEDRFEPAPNYLKSIDAVRAVVLKQSLGTQARFDTFTESVSVLMHTLTARKWCECLLKTTGYWNE